MVGYINQYKKRMGQSLIVCVIFTLVLVLHIIHYKNQTKEAYSQLSQIKESIFKIQLLNKSLTLLSEVYYDSHDSDTLQKYNETLVEFNTLITKISQSQVINTFQLNFNQWDELKGKAIRKHEYDAITAATNSQLKTNQNQSIFKMDTDIIPLIQQYETIVQMLNNEANNLEKNVYNHLSFDSLLIYIFVILDLSILVYFIATQYVLFKKTSAQRDSAEKEKNIVLEHLALIGDVSSGLNHELKNMMTIISGYIAQMPRHLVKAGVKEDDSASKVIQKLTKTIDYTQKIITSVSNMSHQGVGETLHLLSFNSTIGVAVEYGILIAEKNKVDLKIDRLDQEIFALAREVSLIQVFVNLIKNSVEAVQATPNPWIQIKFNIIDNYLQILVQDSGLGIPDIIQKKLFKEKFTTKPFGIGTGVGLTLCRKIIEEHNGHLYIDNNYKNTTFVIELPIAKRHATSSSNFQVETFPNALSNNENLKNIKTA